MFNDIKTQYNLFAHKVSRAAKVLSSPVPMYVQVEHRNAAGELLYHNAAALINQGEESILKGYFQLSAANIPINFKVNLSTDDTILETDTTYNVVTGTGYAEVVVPATAGPTGWVASKPADTWQVTSVNCVFTAGGTWTGAKKVVLAARLPRSPDADILIAYADLTATRYLFIGDTLTVSIVCSLE